MVNDPGDKSEAKLHPPCDVYANKKLKIHRANKWYCRPLSRRIINPNRIRNFHEQLSTIEHNNIIAIDNVICEAKTLKEKKNAIAAKSLLTKYGSSYFMQPLADEPTAKETHMDEVKIKRLACAAAKKVFQEKLSVQVKLVEHDHNYVCTHTTVTDAAEPVCDMTEMMQPNLVTKLYSGHVVVNADHQVSLEENTRSQCASELCQKV